jgi:predicted dehydrogenase
VLITASTKSNEPIHQAASMCRKRGRIVLVGVVGLELSRADFYEKELSFQVSCSYGPGRYDAQYEEAGQDYPLGFVRWTEQRNFEAVLDMLADRRLDVAPLISHRFPLEQAEEAYKLVVGEANPLGILLQYPDQTSTSGAELCNGTVSLIRRPGSSSRPTDDVVVGFIGSGNYATQVLIPAFKETRAVLKSVASLAGVSATYAGKKYGFETSTTDIAVLLDDPGINTVVVATRHDTHARYVCQALRSGRHVFVEKPLAMRREELIDIESAIADGATKNDAPLLMVGFNRRFAPHVQKIKAMLAAVSEPKSFVMTVNAGAISSVHWAQDREVGGGRIIGEGCHFIDLLRFLAGAPISSIRAMSTGRMAGSRVPADVATFSMSFADGSFGVVHYLANGHKSFPKERLEIFCAGRILQLDNFRILKGFGWPGFSKMRLWRQDKGNRACAASFVEAIRQRKPSPIPVTELLEVTRTTFDIVDLLR